MAAGVTATPMGFSGFGWSQESAAMRADWEYAVSPRSSPLACEKHCFEGRILTTDCIGLPAADPLSRCAFDSWLGGCGHISGRYLLNCTHSEKKRGALLIAQTLTNSLVA